MPEPTNEAGQGSQTNQAATAAKIANAPVQGAPDKQTTTQPRAEGNDLKDILRHLDIPEDVQSQLKPKTVQPMEEKLPAGHPSSKEEASTEDAAHKAAAIEDAADTAAATAEESGTEQEQEQEQEGKPDKRQKRINRLTRQKAELEEQLDAARERITNLEVKERPEGRPSPEVPSSSGFLEHISDERTLNQEVAKARSLIQWCNANAEGVTTTGPNGEEKFVAPKEIASWKNDAEMALLGAEPRRREIREYAEQRGKFDHATRQAYPELFDKSSEEYQTAADLESRYPWIKNLPDRNWILGVYIEGLKSLYGRVEAAKGNAAGTTASTGNRNGNGSGTRVPRGQHRDIDERAFEPRVPLAPHSPDTPTREVVPSSHKRLNEAMNKLVADPDGSVGNLANLLNAMESTNTRRAGSRAPVKV